MSAIKTHKSDGTLIVTISRPESMNALNAVVLDGLLKTIQEAYHDDTVSGILLTGEGDKAFVAGADIKELAALSKEQAFALAQKGQRLFKMFEDSPKPVVAAVNGFALGGGCELAMACHMRIATDNAKFGQPEVNLGIIPGYGGTQRLPQLVGRGKALELMLTGDLINAQDAKSIGLVNHVVANRDELMALSLKILGKIAAKGPVAVSKVISSVNAGFSFEQAGYDAEAANFAACTTTTDFTEGTTAFIEKRQPNFTGR